jgi:threonine dehydrogenase-like Zn-dependent dehydrogenase
MKAVVIHGIGDIRLEDVPDPKLEAPTDAIVRLTASAICGTDLHFVRGTFSGFVDGQILGHEGVGIVESVGTGVKNIRVGQRVVIPSTVGCGECQFCRRELYSQCDNANPGGKLAGSVFYGGPEATGNLPGFQAEKARVLYADVNLVPVPDGVTDDQALLVSDILTTAWFGTELAEVGDGDDVVVFGCGPVGQLAIALAALRGARVIAVDRLPDRLEAARKQGVDVINFDQEKVVDAVRRMTNGDGAAKVMDFVGVDAQHPQQGPGEPSSEERDEIAQVRQSATPDAITHGDHWVAGDNPTQVLQWAVECVAKAGIIAIAGVYPPTVNSYPIGTAINKNLTIRMGICDHRRYVAEMFDYIVSGRLDPAKIITQVEPIADVLQAYAAFDDRQPGWMKVELAGSS